MPQIVLELSQEQLDRSLVAVSDHFGTTASEDELVDFLWVRLEEMVENFEKNEIRRTLESAVTKLDVRAPRVRGDGQG